jgi:putative DNA primase/helicase
VQEDYTDLGNARRFARVYGERVRYVTTQNLWLVWEDGRWATDTTHEVQRLARAMVRGFYDQAGAMEEGAASRQLRDWARSCESRARLSAILDLARSERPIAISHEGFDADPWLLNCRNGTVDLRTGTRRPHHREDLITKLCPVLHDPDAICPQWEQFVRRIMGGDDAMACFLQRLCGYLLTGVVREHLLVFAYGRGRNGKSTFWETMLELLGDYALKAGSELIMLRDWDGPGRASPERVQLMGRRLVVMSEVDAAHRLSEAQVKDLTGGDRVAARPLYQAPIMFAPTHKLVLYGNHKPKIQGADDAIWDRLTLIPFPVKFSDDERITDFRERYLLPELPGILSWAVRGCLEWQQQGLQPPLDVIEARNTYRQDMDLVGQFLLECCEVRQGVVTTAQTLYTAYLDWCTTNGLTPLNQRQFTADLLERGRTRSKRGSIKWHHLQLR